MSARRIGVLGLGSIGQRHARNLKALGEQVIAFDPSAAACQRFTEELNGETATRETVIGEATALIIASPNKFHLQDLNDAIEVGVPTLVEKPLGHDPERACELIERADKKGVRVYAAQNLRYRPIVQRARELIADGAIGKPVWAHFVCASWLPGWRPQQDYRQNYAADRETGGVIFDVIHEFDLAFHLLGPAEVMTAAATRSGLLEIEAEDMADIVLRHRNGCQTSLHLDYVTRPRRRRCTATGSNGILEADLRSGALRVMGLDESVIAEESRPVDANREYLAELREFLAMSANGSAAACPAREALAVLRLAAEARQLAGLPLPKMGRPMTQKASA